MYACSLMLNNTRYWISCFDAAQLFSTVPLTPHTASSSKQDLGSDRNQLRLSQTRKLFGSEMNGKNNDNSYLVSTYVVCERLSVMHKQVSVHIPQTVNFCPNSPESPFLEFQTRKFTPPPPWKTSDMRWPKFTLEYPPKWKTSDLRWPKFTLEYPPKWKTSDLRWPKFTLEYPPVGLQSSISYVETNLYPPWIPLV